MEIPVGTPLVYTLDRSTLKALRSAYLGEPQAVSSTSPVVGIGPGAPLERVPVRVSLRSACRLRARCASRSLCACLRGVPGGERLVEPSSWGLLTPSGPPLTAWLTDLKRVGLIRSPVGIMQVSAWRWGEAAQRLVAERP